MPKLLGLKSRHSKCKICSSLSDEDLNSITLDILTGNRTWDAMCEFYSPKLKFGTKPINTININSHKHHCDISAITKEELQVRGYLPTSEAEAIFKLYQKAYSDTISYSEVLEEVTRQRIKNLSHMQAMLEEEVKLWRTSAAIGDKSGIMRARMAIGSLQKDIDQTLGDMGRTISQHIRTEKGLGDTQIYVNIVNVVGVGISTALTELIGVLTLEEFPRDLERAQRVHAKIAQLLDKHVAPVLTQLVPKQLTG